MTNFSSAVRNYYSRYFALGGRSDRPQYWWVQLYLFFVEAIFYWFIAMCNHGSFGYYFWYVMLYAFGIVNIMPSLALAVRRMHDIGKGGGWIFINFVPVVGNIWFLILTLFPSQGANRFGDPVD